MFSINNETPSDLSKAKAYLKQYESFAENPIYLDETDLLYFTASAANDLTYFVSYELLDDA